MSFIHYPWAANKLKCEQAYNDVVAAKNLDPKVEVTEEAVKARYIKRLGLIIEKNSSETAHSELSQAPTALAVPDNEPKNEETKPTRTRRSSK